MRRFRLNNLFAAMLLLLALTATAPAADKVDPPGPPAPGSRVLGKFDKISFPEGSVILCTDNPFGIPVPPKAHHYTDVANWDVAVGHLKGFSDGSIPGLVLHGHGSLGAGVSTKTAGKWLDYPALTDEHAAVIRAKLRSDAPVIIHGCHAGTSKNLQDLGAKLQRRVIANTGVVYSDLTAGGDWVDVHPLAPRKDTLLPGETLRAGEQRVSSDGATSLVMQEDGNLVLYHKGKALWASNTYGVTGASCVMQHDGNLVVYGSRGGASGAVWASNTYLQLWTHLVVQDDANLVLYQVGKPVWASNTNR